jgi:hypothetical protein
MTLKIYDHLDTVDLDTPEAKIEKNGWPQSGPTPLPGGRFADVEETIRVAWLKEDDNDRAAEMVKMGNLAIRALQVQNPLHPFYDAPAKHPIIEVKTPTETNTRYATISMIRSPQLDTRHQGNQQWLALSAKVTREGLWRGIKPGSAPINLFSSATVHSYISGGSVNYVTVDPADIDGDAPGLLRLTVKPKLSPASGFLSDLFVSVVTADSLAELNQMELWHLANSATSIENSGTVVDATDAGFGETPDTKAIRWQARQLGTANYNLANSLARTAGAFQIYVVGCAIPTTSDLATSRVLYGFLGGEVVGDPVRYGTDTVSDPWRLRYLGEVQIPPGGLVRGMAASGTFRFRHRFEASANTDFYLAAGFLIPTTEQFFTVRLPDPAIMPIGGGDRLVIDGEIERVYLHPEEEESIKWASFPVGGMYPTLTPGKYNRIFFYPMALIPSTIKGVHKFTNQYSVNVDYVPRYQYLRGAG